jgi:hypothetical protein
MSFLGSWKIDEVLTFPAITHRFDSGALTDADAVPAYRVYEDETTTAILTGNMAKLDDASTTGFYSEAITLSAANGFEKGKCYTVYITAAVNSVTGGSFHTFQVKNDVVDALNVDTYAEPGVGVPAATASLAAKINYIYKAWRNRVAQTATTYTLYGDDAATAHQSATLSDDGTTFTKGEVGTG